MVVRSRNITGSSLLGVEEKCTYTPHPKNKNWYVCMYVCIIPISSIHIRTYVHTYTWMLSCHLRRTKFRHEATITSFVPIFHSPVEDWSLSTFTTKAVLVRSYVLYIKQYIHTHILLYTRDTCTYAVCELQFAFSHTTSRLLFLVFYLSWMLSVCILSISTFHLT